jgi:hypothetical protein
LIFIEHDPVAEDHSDILIQEGRAAPRHHFRFKAIARIEFGGDSPFLDRNELAMPISRLSLDAPT